MRFSISMRVNLVFLLIFGSLLILTVSSSLNANGNSTLASQNGSSTSLISSTSSTSKVKRSSPSLLSELEKESFESDDDNEEDEDDDEVDDDEIAEEGNGHKNAKFDETEDEDDDEDDEDSNYSRKRSHPLKRTIDKTKKWHTNKHKRFDASRSLTKSRKINQKSSKAKRVSKQKQTFESDDDEDDDDDDEDDYVDDNEKPYINKRKLGPKTGAEIIENFQKEKKKKSSLFDAQLKFTSDELCSDIRCQPNEYCFVPSPGIAECLPKPIYARTPPKPQAKKPQFSSFTLDNDDQSDKVENDDNEDDDDDDEEEKAEEELRAEKRKNTKNNNRKIQSSRVVLRKSATTSVVSKPITDDEDYEEDEDEDNDDEDFENEKFTKSNKKSSVNFYKSTNLQLPSESTAKTFNSSKVHSCPPCPSTNEYGHSKFNHQQQVICGSDNASYSSSCRLDFHNCVHGTEVRFACFGFCPCLRVYEKVLIQQLKNSGPKNFQHHKSSSEKQHHSSYQTHPTYSPLKKSIYYKSGGSSSLSSSSAEKVRIKTKKGTANEVLQRKELAKMHYHLADGVSGGSKECSMEQLRSMGLRLLDWFAVVMKEELKHNKSSANNNNKNRRSTLPKSNNTNFSKKSPSSANCEPPVGFMFGHFDADGDGRLSLKELYYLEHDENEHCLEPYLSACDLDGDNFLGTGEWCDCFSLKAKPCLYHVKHLQKELAANSANSGRPLLGAYIPQCTPAGHYEKVQCNKATNWCWCADKNGNEIAGTRVRGRSAKCDKTYPLVKNRQYQQQQQKQQKSFSALKSTAIPPNSSNKGSRPKNNKKQTNSKNGKTQPPPSPPPPEDLDLEDGEDDDDAGEELRESSFTSNLDGGSGSSSLDL